MLRVFGETTKNNVIRGGGLLAAGFVLAGLIGNSSSAENIPRHPGLSAVELLSDTSEQGSITPHDEFPGNGTRIIHSPDSIQVGEDGYVQFSLPVIEQFCSNKDLMTVVLDGNVNYAYGRGSAEVTQNAPECADNWLSREDFHPSH